jgi:hypothetical protein
MDHVQETNDRGKTVIRKVGMAPIQRDGVEYEFDVIGELDIDNVMTVTKTRNPAFKDLQVVRPTREFGRRLRDWLEVPAPAGVVQLPDRSAQTWSAPPAEGARAVPPLEAGPPIRPDQGDDDAFAEGMAGDERSDIWWPMPEANAFACQAVGCDFTFRSADEIVYGGKRFRGRQLAERTLADAQKPLCAPHAKAWNDGTDVFTEAAAV